MPFRWERREAPSLVTQALAPVASVLLTLVVGALIIDLAGMDGQRAVVDLFLTPLLASYKWPDVAVKAAPLVIIALGLSVGHRAQVWNLGAEGQYLLGAVAAAGVARAWSEAGGPLVLLGMVLAGALGGAAWAAIPAALRTRLAVNEVLSSLMLSYVALQGLGYLVGGPWKDPDGHNFPATAVLPEDLRLPIVVAGTTLHLGVVVALLSPLAFWFLLSRTILGYEIRVVGASPQAARHGGFAESQTVWACLLISGGMAGLAGALEFSGRVHKLDLGFPSGYGFTAIIVSFLGRVHPLGCLVAGVVLAVTSVGGQLAKTTVHLPDSTAAIFQSMMLFFILASDRFVRYRVRWAWSARAPRPTTGG